MVPKFWKTKKWYNRLNDFVDKDKQCPEEINKKLRTV